MIIFFPQVIVHSKAYRVLKTCSALQNLCENADSKQKRMQNKNPNTVGKTFLL